MTKLEMLKESGMILVNETLESYAKRHTKDYIIRSIESYKAFMEMIRRDEEKNKAC